MPCSPQKIAETPCSMRSNTRCSAVPKGITPQPNTANDHLLCHLLCWANYNPNAFMSMRWDWQSKSRPSTHTVVHLFVMCLPAGESTADMCSVRQGWCACFKSDAGMQGRERKGGMRKGTGRGKEAGKGACKGKGEHWGDQLLRASCMLRCYHYIWQSRPAVWQQEQCNHRMHNCKVYVGFPFSRHAVFTSRQKC